MMNIKKEKQKDLRSWMFITSIFFLVLVFTGFAIDMKISNSFSAKINGFTLLFKIWGEYIVIVPIYYASLLFINKFIFKRDYRRLIIMLISILMIAIYLIYFLRKTIFNNETIDQDSLEGKLKISGIIVLTMIAIVQSIYVSVSLKFVNEEFIKKTFKNIITMIIFMILIWSTTGSLKIFFGRPRPEFVIDEGHSDDFMFPFVPFFGNDRGYSFPSGHTTAAATLFAFLYLIDYEVNWKKIVYWSTYGLVLIYTLITAVARIMIHAHWFSDTMFAISIVLFWQWMTPVIVSKIFNKKEKNNG